MKTKKSLLVLPAIALVFALVFTTCSNGGGGGGGRQDNSSGSVRFNLTGAKAIAAAQGGSGNGRAVNGSGNYLLKLLENGSFESIVSGNHEIPEIHFLASSPVEGKKDIYISFAHGWQTDNGTMIGNFIHVKEDGSVVNILEGDTIERRYTWVKYNNTSPVAFDRYGNMYFRVDSHDNHLNPHNKVTHSIYKYNPATGKKEQLVPADPNISYGKIVVSSDGSYLIVDGDRYRSNGDLDVSFVRIIPTANPQNMVEQITVRWDEGDGSGGQTGETFWWLAYAFGRRNELYVSGGKIFDDENKNGFYKVTFEGLSPDEWQWEKLFDAQENGYAFASIVILFVAPDNSIWGNDGSIARIINSNGQPDFYQSYQSYQSSNVLQADISGPFKSSASHLYFNTDDLDTKYGIFNVRGDIYRVSYNNPTGAQNVLSGITTRTNNILVFNYDISGDYLYFCAVENPQLLDDGLTPDMSNYDSDKIRGDYFSGRINLTTLEYTELEFSWNITALVAY